MKFVLILSLLLCSCGLVSYKTVVTFDENTRTATMISNIPAKGKIKDIEIDQKSQSWWEKVLDKSTPETVKIEK